MKYMAYADFENLLKITKPRAEYYYYAFLICGELGLRIHELLKLKSRNFNREKNLVMISRGNKSSFVDEVPLPKNLVPRITYFLDSKGPDEPLFKLSQRQFQRKFNDLCLIAGIKNQTISSLRHMKGIELANQGLNHYQIAMYLRHRNVDTARIYVEEVNKINKQ